MKPTVTRALALGALISPTAVYALGLGDIHLHSALNQPFNAEIELVAATPDDLAALRAALASNETFDRYGLDKPAYLSDFTFRVDRGSEGKDVLRVTSPKPVTEPFVTLLVEATWPRGRLLREYTVLLDPPTFAAAPPVAAPTIAAERPAAPVTAPVAAPAPAEPRNLAPEPAPQPRAPEAPREAAPAAAPARAGTYRVQPNDTLYRIASRVDVGGGADVNQTMVALYQGNPEAFEGNINVVRSGALLRIPQSSEVAAISARAAAEEVARQYRIWQDGHAAAAVSEGGRLRLVPPKEGSPVASTTTTRESAATARSGGGLEARVQQLETELAEARRLIELQSAQLANMQGNAAGANADAAPATTPPAVDVAGETPTESTATDAATDSAAALAAADAAPTADATASEPEAREAAPAPVEKKKQKPAKAKPVQPESPSLLSRVADYWWLLGAGLVVLLGAIAALLKRRQSAGDPDETLEETFAAREASHAARAVEMERNSGNFVVEEREEADVPVVTAAKPASRTPAAPSVEAAAATAAAADGTDPIAEADFHMAYGLYDQAADMVQAALRREPNRRDLKLKLLEVCFVWGNRDRFLEVARTMNGRIKDADSSADWDKVMIMGRQIAPDDAMFGGTLGPVAGMDLDLDLHSGDFDQQIDDAETHAASLPDIDLAATTPGVISESGLDFVLDEPGRGADVDLAKLAPTVEMPRPGLGASSRPPVRTESTDEVSIDRLGLDVDAMTSLGSLDQPQDDELSGMTGEIEGTVEVQKHASAARSLDDTAEDLLSATAMLKMQTGTSEALTVILEAEESTGEQGRLDRTDFQVELPTIETPRPALQANDETMLASDLTAYADVSFPPVIEESSTMNEVGTKLDLARAYIDMGDPEGARSILDEVVEEGSANQQQEAQRLIAALP